MNLWRVPLLSFAAGGMAIAAWEAGKDKGADYKFINEVLEIKHLISTRYVETPDENALREGAIRGMVESLNDPFTVYVPRSERLDFNKDLTGEYVGIGAQVNVSTGWLTVVSPLEDSPAYRAGILPDDKIVKIDGTSTEGLAVEKCVDLLMGDPGTPVNLTIDRAGQLIELTIVRDKIKTRSVKGVHRDPADPEKWDYTIDAARGIAYVRLTQFTPGCAGEFAKALEQEGAGRGEVKGLIIDLRLNPGGTLSDAQGIADLFLKDGVIVSTRGRGELHPEEVARAKEPGTLPEFPIVVLINEESASASEILAGALAENERAILVGERTFGKGSVQSVLTPPSGEGAELKLTEQGYYLPSGRSIARKDDSPDWGVDPSPGYYVPMTDKELNEMIGVRRKLEVIARQAAENAGTDQPEQRWDDPAWILEQLKDKQLTAALTALQARVESREWKQTGEAGPERGQIAAGELTRLREAKERIFRELIRLNRRLEALETASAGVASASQRDFWEDGVDLKDGTLTVQDKDGKTITTLKITGANLERWLLDADVEKSATPPTTH